MKHIPCHEFEFEAYCCHAPSHLLLLSLCVLVAWVSVRPLQKRLALPPYRWAR